MKLSFALSFVVCAFISFGAYAEKVKPYSLLEKAPMDVEVEGRKVAKKAIAFETKPFTAEEMRLEEARILEKEKQNIVNSVSDLSCKTNVSCRVVGLGNRACGGHEGFLLYSSDNLTQAEFLEKVSGYNGRTSMYNQKYAMSSICSIEIEPKTQCVENVCKIMKVF